jgi:hypothetical protein
MLLASAKAADKASVGGIVAEKHTSAASNASNDHGTSQQTIEAIRLKVLGLAIKLIQKDVSPQEPLLQAGLDSLGTIEGCHASALYLQCWLALLCQVSAAKLNQSLLSNACTTFD